MGKSSSRLSTTDAWTARKVGSLIVEYMRSILHRFAHWPIPINVYRLHSGCRRKFACSTSKKAFLLRQENLQEVRKQWIQREGSVHSSGQQESPGLAHKTGKTVVARERLLELRRFSRALQSSKTKELLLHFYKGNDLGCDRAVRCDAVKKPHDY